MSKSNLRIAILVLGLVTGVIHAIILNIVEFNSMMLVNGLGFFVLTWATYVNPKFLAGKGKLVAYLFMAYTLVTIIGFFLINQPPYGPLGIIAKVDEVLLLVALWMYKDK